MDVAMEEVAMEEVAMEEVAVEQVAVEAVSMIVVAAMIAEAAPLTGSYCALATALFHFTLYPLWFVIASSLTYLSFVISIGCSSLSILLLWSFCSCGNNNCFANFRGRR